MSAPATIEAQSLLQQWLNGIRIAHMSHSIAAARCKLKGQLFGIPVTVLSIITGTTIFGSLKSSRSDHILMAVGIISLLAAVLSGLQTFLNYPEQSQKHY